jgi:hypothetical protein
MELRMTIKRPKKPAANIESLLEKKGLKVTDTKKTVSNINNNICILIYREGWLRTAD